MNVREWALPIYTILMQMTFGMTLFLWIIRTRDGTKLTHDEMDDFTHIPLLIIFCTIFFAMIGAHFHLSKPALSIFAVTNYRTSWLSREIIFTLLFFGTVGSLVAGRYVLSVSNLLKTALGWLAVLFGGISVYCMSQIYLLPSQTSWNSPLTIISFYGTALLLGSTSLATIIAMDLRFSETWKSDQIGYRSSLVQKSLGTLAVFAVVAFGVITLANIYQLAILRAGSQSARTSFELAVGIYRPLLLLRLVLPFIGVGWFIFFMRVFPQWKATGKDGIMHIYLACILITIGEILGRFLFYATHVRIGV